MIKLVDLLVEFQENKIISLLKKWGLNPEDANDPDVINARKLLTRFEEIKSTLPAKIDILNVSDEIKNKDIRNIDLYSLDDLDKLIKSYPENEEKIKKAAVERFVKNDFVDKATAQSYVARFLSKKRDLDFAVKNGTEDFTKEEVLAFIPERLRNRDAYLDPRNWKWQAFEQMLDALFPSQKKISGDEAINTATTDADKIYDSNGIEIYKGNERDKCVSYNPTVDVGGSQMKKYSWCVAQPGNTMYSSYRFGPTSPTFYFVFDRSKSSEPSSPGSRTSFVDPYHAIVIQVSEDKSTYTVTDAGNRGDKTVKGWDAIQTVVPADTWVKIKGLKDYFEPIPLSSRERMDKMASGRNLSLNEFKELNEEEKIFYIQSKGRDSKLTPDILAILPQYKIKFQGRSTTLANIAINSGQVFTYDQLKNNEALAKHYAAFRFRHTDYGNNPLPLLFVKYLDEEGQKEYYKKFSDEQLNFDLIQKFFSKQILDSYIKEQLKNFAYLPESAGKYITDPKDKQRFALYPALYGKWKQGRSYNISDEELGKISSMPSQTMHVESMLYSDWKKLPEETKKAIVSLAKGVTTDDKYDFINYALPIVVNYNNRDLLLLPVDGDMFHYVDWVLTDVDGNIIKDNIDGILQKNNVYQSTVNDSPLLDGTAGLYGSDSKHTKYVDAANVVLNGEPLTSMKLQESQTIYDDWDRYVMLKRAGIIQ